MFPEVWNESIDVSIPLLSKRKYVFVAVNERVFGNNTITDRTLLLTKHYNSVEQECLAVQENRGQQLFGFRSSKNYK